MALITTITDRTVELTRRPEIPDITSSAIRTATLRAHHVDFFPRDLASSILSAAPTSLGFTDFQNISTSLPRLRSIKSVQILDPNSGAPIEQLEYRNTDDLFTSDGIRRPHVYTLLGDTLRIYSSLPAASTAVFYFQNPNIAGLQYYSWIAETYPDEIAAWAAAIVFARTGYAEMANQFQGQHIDPFKEMLVSSHLLGNVS